MEQLEHVMLGNRIYLWLHDGRSGIFNFIFQEKNRVALTIFMISDRAEVGEY